MQRTSAILLLLFLILAPSVMAAPGTDDPPGMLQRVVRIIKQHIVVPLDGLISVPKP